jgi:hypothetical protein
MIELRNNVSLISTSFYNQCQSVEEIQTNEILVEFLWNILDYLLTTRKALDIFPSLIHLPILSNNSISFVHKCVFSSYSVP